MSPTQRIGIREDAMLRSDHGRQEAADSESVLDLTDSSLATARAAAERAYADARRLVYDRLPTGPVDPTLLDDEQQRALGRLTAAERRLDELRTALHSDRG